MSSSSPPSVSATQSTSTRPSSVMNQEKTPTVKVGAASPPRQSSPHSHKPRHNFRRLSEEEPMESTKHSRIPYFLRLKGSVTPKMIIALIFISGWATAMTCVYKWVHDISVDTVLLTILGFVVALGISFRTSSAYERHSEGRRYWALCIQASRDLARHLWIHVRERHDEIDPTTGQDLGKEDLLAKLSALNLIVAFSVSLKHHLRNQPYASYEDLKPLIGHISTLAGDTNESDTAVTEQHRTRWREYGQNLGLVFAEYNPRKLLEKATQPLGNLPLEILTYISGYVDAVMEGGNAQLSNGAVQGIILANLGSLNEALSGTERIHNTPLPLAYTIAISQITWLYVIALPFQLVKTLGWITIPATVISAYIILGFAAIGREIEDPFGSDPNDLPLEEFCDMIAEEVAIITSRSAPALRSANWIRKDSNNVLLPLQRAEYPMWKDKSESQIRDALSVRVQFRRRRTKENARTSRKMEV